MARDFDDTDDQYIDVGTWFISGPRITFSLFAQVDDFSPGDFRFFSKAQGTQEDDHQWMLSNNSASQIQPRLRIQTAGGDARTLIGSGTGDTDNGWHHYVGFYDASLASENLKIYYDGSLNSEVTHTTINNLAETTTNIYIGNQPVTTAKSINGRIAEVAVWAAALNTDEIAALAAGISPRFIRHTSLEGYWPLQGIGSPEPDYSGNGRTGTLNGDTTTPTIADHVYTQPLFGFNSDWKGSFTEAVTFDAATYPHLIQKGQYPFRRKVVNY